MKSPLLESWHVQRSCGGMHMLFRQERAASHPCAGPGEPCRGHASDVRCSRAHLTRDSRLGSSGSFCAACIDANYIILCAGLAVKRFLQCESSSKLFLRLAESIYGGSFGHVGPANRYGRWAQTTRESGLYRYHWVHRAWEASSDASCTGWYL